jgi:hypothetical protein
MTPGKKILLLLLSSAIVSAAEPLTRDSLAFKNGDLLYGSLQSITLEKGLELKRSDAPEPLQFQPEFLSEINLSQRSSAPTNEVNACTVQLTNGDQFDGQLVSYDGSKVVVDTWYAGTLTLANEVVAMILPINNSKRLIFEGPGELKDWTMGKVNANAAGMEGGQWHLFNGALYANKSASIARDVKLPDISSFQFDMEWRGFFHIAVALYTQYLHPVSLATKETEPTFGGFYSLQVNPFSASLLPVRQMDPLRHMGQAPLQTLGQKTSAHFDIRVNKQKKTIALLVDGVMVRQWAETEDFAGTGTAIRFVHQGQGAVKLTNIRVYEWDGTFDETATVSTNKTQDLARLRNGDRVMGDVKSITEGKMTVQSTGTSLSIPLTRVKQIEFVAAKPRASHFKPTTVRAYFAQGGRLTLDLESLQNGEIHGTSPSFGPGKFKLAAFNRLVFDPEIPEPKGLN